MKVAWKQETKKYKYVHAIYSARWQKMAVRYKERVVFLLDSELYDRMKGFVQRKGITVSDFLRGLIREALEKEEGGQNA